MVQTMGGHEAERNALTTVAELMCLAARTAPKAKGVDNLVTAVIAVHPRGLEDGQGWRTSEPAGVAFFCTPEKNRLGLRHAATVINPFLKRLHDFPYNGQPLPSEFAVSSGDRFPRRTTQPHIPLFAIDNQGLSVVSNAGRRIYGLKEVTFRDVPIMGRKPVALTHHLYLS